MKNSSANRQIGIFQLSVLLLFLGLMGCASTPPAPKLMAVETVRIEKIRVRSKPFEAVCSQQAQDGSDVAKIRERIKSDLKNAGVSDFEIAQQLEIYDVKTCDLRR